MALLERWDRVIQLARQMVDDEAVRAGTRYDAMRLLGTDTFERSGADLTKYLRNKVDVELEMGAISSLADMESLHAFDSITAAFPGYSSSNQALAITLLLRNETRITALIDAIEERTIPATSISTEQWLELKEAKNQDLRMRITALQHGHSKNEPGTQSSN